MKESKIPAVILYIKVPKVGFVKTRLISKHVTALDAYEIQKAMIVDTLLTLESLEGKFKPIISYYPKKNLQGLKEFIHSKELNLSKSFTDKIFFIAQEGYDNGNHFASTFKKVQEMENISSSIILGGDTPHIDSSIIIKALEYLENNSSTAIIGPSQLGGFYLFGSNIKIHNLESIFLKSNEFANLINLCLNSGVNVKTLPFVFDIDKEEDLLSLYYIFEPILDKQESLKPFSSLSYPNNTIFLLKKILYFS
jgi:glycosyltransferase A (GT-A) superfamily protein (DUF2064 family)